MHLVKNLTTFLHRKYRYRYWAQQQQRKDAKTSSHFQKSNPGSDAWHEASVTHKKVRFLRGTIRDSRATYPASCQTDLLWQCLKGSIKMVEEAGRKRRGGRRTHDRAWARGTTSRATAPHRPKWAAATATQAYTNGRQDTAMNTRHLETTPASTLR